MIYPRIDENSLHAKYINLLGKIAADIQEPVSGNARLASCIVYKKDIVSFGFNAHKTHPFQAKFGANKESIYLHAEVSAIKNALREISVDDLSRSTLYVCRVKYESCNKKNIMFSLSKPCCGCERCIQTFGIKKVYHTVDNGYVLYK
jgi:tRNA(Arg) A34 adenosine deaminase TadA